MIRRTIQKLCTILLIQVIFGCTAGSVSDSMMSSRGNISALTSDTVSSYPPVQVEDLTSYQVDLPGFYVSHHPLNAVCYNVDYDELPGKSKMKIDSESPVVVGGYRIQLFSGREREYAKFKEAELKVKYPYEVYLIYEAPLYKVRIGDFRSMDIANRFCRQIRNDGYMDAWVIKSPIIIR